MRYTVVRIEEDLDFGCEEREEGESVRAVVTLEDEEGRRRVLRIADALLYERGIEEGSQVWEDEAGEWRRI